MTPTLRNALVAPRFVRSVVVAALAISVTLGVYAAETTADKVKKAADAKTPGWEALCETGWGLKPAEKKVCVGAMRSAYMEGWSDGSDDIGAKFSAYMESVEKMIASLPAPPPIRPETTCTRVGNDTVSCN